MTRPQLTRRSAGPRPKGVVLMLHGGTEHNLDPVGTSGPWLRSRLMMAQIGRALRAADLDVWLLRYRLTGWNVGHGPEPSPVPDARWALEEVRLAHGNLPVVLLGHSMGARTAAAVADEPSVHGVVGLAPWFPPDEPVAPLAGKHLVAAHGRADRITSFEATAAFVDRALQGPAPAASARLVDMGDRDHYMLKGIGDWNRVARDCTRALFDVLRVER